MTYATPTDVANELGRPTPVSPTVEQWQRWLDKVERAIVRGFKNAGLVLDDEITEGRVDVDDVKDVEATRVAARVGSGLAPGLTSTTVSIDDGSITNRREGVAADIDPLELTDADWELLLPRTIRGSWSIPLAGKPGFADEVCWP